jgi:plasmid stabilization system protein ParE
MRYRLVVQPLAEQDIEDSFLWYEDQSPGLGHAFRLKVRAALADVRTRPLSFPVIKGRTRRIILARFPYSILFLVDGEKIAVTGCVHHARHPNIWRSRK